MKRKTKPAPRKRAPGGGRKSKGDRVQRTVNFDRAIDDRIVARKTRTGESLSDVVNDLMREQ